MPRQPRNSCNKGIKITRRNQIISRPPNLQYHPKMQVSPTEYAKATSVTSLDRVIGDEVKLPEEYETRCISLTLGSEDKKVRCVRDAKASPACVCLDPATRSLGE